MVKSDAAAQGGKKSEIVAIATDHFLSQGYAATSMSKIAAAAGLGKASLYHHFTSKEQLFVAAITLELSESARQISCIARDNTLDHEERVRQAMIIVYDACVRSNAGRMAPIVAETSRFIPMVAQGFHDSFIAAMKAEMCSIVAAGAKDGVFRNLDQVGLDHLTFGPPVMLAMSRAMFSDVPGTEADLDIDHALQTHTAMLLDLLRVKRVVCGRV